MKINDISSRPIPPSGITRISLWRHGMGRHQIVSRSEFGRVIDTIIDLNSSLYADHIIMPSEQIICFNIRADIPIAEFGYIHGAAGNHKDIKFPELANAPLTGMIAPSMKETEPPWITLSTVNTDELEGNTEEELFSKYVSAARFLSENNMPFETMLVRGLINDLAFLNDACDMRLFTTPIKTLGDLARQALPQDMPPSGINEFRLWRVGDKTSRQVEPEEFRKAINAFSGNNALFNICLDDDNSVSLGMIIDGEDIPYKHLKIRGGCSSTRAFSGHVNIDKRKHVLTYSTSRANEYIKLGPGFSKYLSDDHIRIARCFIENGFPADIHLSGQMSYDIKEMLEITALTIADLARQPLTGEIDANQ